LACGIVWVNFEYSRSFLGAAGVDEMTLKKRFNGSGFRVQRLNSKLINFGSNKPKAYWPDINFSEAAMIFLTAS